jgi:hypothetical protein
MAGWIGAISNLVEPLVDAIGRYVTAGAPPDERRSVRQAQAVLLLDQFHQWLIATLGRVSIKSEIAYGHQLLAETLVSADALLRGRTS